MNTYHLPSYTSTSQTTPYTGSGTSNHLPSILSSTRSGIYEKSTLQLPSPAASNISNPDALLPDQICDNLDTSPVSADDFNTYTVAQQSPRSTSQSFFETYPKEPLDWSMHSPPRSDSATASVIPGGSFPHIIASSAPGAPTTTADMRFVT